MHQVPEIVVFVQNLSRQHIYTRLKCHKICWKIRILEDFFQQVLRKSNPVVWGVPYRKCGSFRFSRSSPENRFPRDSLESRGVWKACATGLLSRWMQTHALFRNTRSPFYCHLRRWGDCFFLFLKPRVSLEPRFLYQRCLASSPLLCTPRGGMGGA